MAGRRRLALAVPAARGAGAECLAVHAACPARLQPRHSPSLCSVEGRQLAQAQADTVGQRPDCSRANLGSEAAPALQCSGLHLGSLCVWANVRIPRPRWRYGAGRPVSRTQAVFGSRRKAMERNAPPAAAAESLRWPRASLDRQPEMDCVPAERPVLLDRQGDAANTRARFARLFMPACPACKLACAWRVLACGERATNARTCHERTLVTAYTLACVWQAAALAIVSDLVKLRGPPQSPAAEAGAY